VDATAGLLAGFPVAAQSAVLPLHPRNGEQVTIEEYMGQMLSCDDPNKVLQLLGECSRKYEKEFILHHTEELATKIVWAANHPNAITKQDHGCGCVYGKHRCTDKRAEQ
jgi:hypothetical protein